LIESSSLPSSYKLIPERRSILPSVSSQPYSLA
jgi:hypothetical protein